jgi:hypothetical protein
MAGAEEGVAKTFVTAGGELWGGGIDGVSLAERTDPDEYAWSGLD